VSVESAEFSDRGVCVQDCRYCISDWSSSTSTLEYAYLSNTTATAYDAVYAIACMRTVVYYVNWQQNNTQYYT